MAQKGVDSYVTVDEADSYFESRLDVAAWTSAPEPMKSKALVTATTLLENIEWTGQIVSDTQPLAFPRSGVFFDPRLGHNVLLPTNSVPDRVLKSQMELAYHLLNNDGLLDNTGSATGIAVEGVRLENIRAPETFPDIVRALVAPLRVRSSSQWFRAN